MGSILPTRNSYGWTSDVPNQITCELLRQLPEFGPQPVVLDIGAGFGVATLPLLEAGARVITNDIDESHLRRINQGATEIGQSAALTAVLGKFPQDLTFRGLDAVHCSNVLHFLRGDEIIAGTQRIYEWLKPGGKVFIQVGTIFAGHIRKLVPEFEQRRRAGLVWAGETDRAKDFVLPQFRLLTPDFMNYLDGPPLVEAFERAGFTTEQAWYYTRHGLPEDCRNDGRENFGYIGEKPNGYE